MYNMLHFLVHGCDSQNDSCVVVLLLGRRFEVGWNRKAFDDHDGI